VRDILGAVVWWVGEAFAHLREVAAGRHVTLVEASRELVASRDGRGAVS
jgi:hypothetical protein